MAEHGGGILKAATRYGIAPERWLDLSTGINPRSWPVPVIPERVWNRLPESGDDLLPAAATYYGTDALVVVPGSQAAIQLLPTLRSNSRVGIVSPAYFEHERWWRAAGHDVTCVAPADIEVRLETLDVLLLANPNNPTGERQEPKDLLAWHARLAHRGGWLVVDEAFMDATPGGSILAATGAPGLVVLRSLGKFFGLAGARVGFVMAWPDLLAEIEIALGPWPVAGPARFVAAAALRDRAWQAATREGLAAASRRLAAVLSAHGLAPDGVTSLFAWRRDERAPQLQEALARRGIWIRRFDAPPSLRFGLPGSEEDWQRLTQALTEICS